MRQLTVRYQPRHRVESRLHGYAIATAADEASVHRAQELRHEVLLVEGMGHPLPGLRDHDAYDRISDHLLVSDAANGVLVATLRLHEARPGEPLWTQALFRLDRLLALPGGWLELDRSCIRKPWRNNQTLFALCQGVAEYLAAAGSAWLLCGFALPTLPLRTLDAVRRWLRLTGQALPEGVAPPHRPYFPGPGRSAVVTAAERSQVEAVLPAMLRLWLRLGARVGLDPAWDDERQAWVLLAVLEPAGGRRALLAQADAA